MKKVVLVLCLGSVLFTSCSIYTCPTYAKKAEPAQKEQIQKENV